LVDHIKRALTQTVARLEIAKTATDTTIAAAQRTGNF